MQTFKEFLAKQEAFLSEAFSPELKKKLSSKVLHEIARRLQNYGISANNVTFENLSKDQQAKLKRRVKDAEGVGRFVIIVTHPKSEVEKELLKYKKLAKEHKVDLKDGDTELKIRDLIDQSKSMCYFIDTQNSDCTRIQREYEYDYSWFDDSGKATYSGNNKILTRLGDKVVTGKWEGYVAEIQEIMRNSDYDAYVIKDLDGNAYIRDLETSRRVSRETNDPLSTGYYSSKSNLYKQHQEEVQNNKNKKNVKEDAKMVKDFINKIDDIRELLNKCVDATVVGNKKGADRFYWDAYYLAKKLSQVIYVVDEFRNYNSDYYIKDTNIHERILRKISEIK